MSIYDPLICSHCQSSNRASSSYCVACGRLLKPTNNHSKKVVMVVVVFGAIAILILWIAAVAMIDERRSNAEPLTRAKVEQPEVTKPTPSPTQPELTAAEKLNRARQMTAGEPSNQQMYDALKLLRTIPSRDKESRDALALEKTLTEKLARIMAEETLLGPKPENSAWDGSVRCVDRYLSQVLNDYHDSEYLEWSPVAKIYLKKEPYWGVRLKLRARNAFGAKIVKQVVFLIRNNQVVAAEGL